MTPTGPSARRRRTFAATALVLIGLLCGPAAAAVAATRSPTPTPTQSGTAATPSASPSTSSAQNTFGLGPSSATGPDGRPVFNLAATPGATIRDHVAVLNYSVKPLSLQVYATDAVATDDGQFVLKNGDDKPTELGSWITLDTEREIVVPGRSATGPGLVVVPTLIRIPRDAAPGDLAGGIIVSLTATASTPDQPNVALEQRVATRVYLRVSGELRPSLEVTDLRAEYQGTLNPAGSGQAVVTYTVRNTGNVRLGVSPQVSVTGLLGSSTGSAPAQPPILLPGGSITLESRVDGVLPGVRLTAQVTATPLTAGGDSDPRLPDVTATTAFWAIPWPWIAITLLVLAAGVAWALRRRAAAVPEPRGARERTPAGVR